MRIAFSVIFIGLITALGICSYKARRSPKTIGFSVSLLTLGLIPPVIGNLMIISSGSKSVSTVGCYIYFLGMDFVMAALLRFTIDYCRIKKARLRYKLPVHLFLLSDVVQLLLNPVYHHAFDTEAIPVSGFAYYRLIPHPGQTYHRVVCYGILFASLIIFLVKSIKVPRIYAESYYVILLTMVFTAVWQTFYIFSRTPVDRSMIGFGVFGLLVYYFSLYYRPMRLLDSMLAGIASELPEALFFFDVNGQCIWVNAPAKRLAGIKSNKYDNVQNRLEGLFGSLESGADEWSEHKTTGEGDGAKNYILERRVVNDERGRCIGSFLRVRDNTSEQRTLDREIYKATHDRLTGLYDRAGYELLLPGLDLSTTYMFLIDADDFKNINDTYGHETGDRILCKIAETLKTNFRAEDHVCRIGGDEFVVFMVNAEDARGDNPGSKIDRINIQLENTDDGLPPISVSAGIAHGKDAADAAVLFERADSALYETKRRGRHGYTFYTAKRS